MLLCLLIPAHHVHIALYDGWSWLWFCQEGAGKFVTTEHEPVFDAAEFTRMGRDIFVQR